MSRELIIPQKLKAGDTIRVVSPSRSAAIIDGEVTQIARERFEALGLKVTFSENAYHVFDEDYMCASVDERVSDLHAAFSDDDVKAIFTIVGGFNVNQILDKLDYDLIRSHPKILCGFSDITALSTAIYAKTGLQTYSGPHFSSFGMKKGFDYSLEYFKRLLMADDETELLPSADWSNDHWHRDQENRDMIRNDDYEIYRPGTAEGTIIGGNLCTLNLLQGTEYFPDDDNLILFVEDDCFSGKEFLREFDRDLQSLLHALKGRKINGVVFGRAEKVSEMNLDKWHCLIRNKPELNDIPVIINANFGHTTPIFTFPIGGHCRIENGKIYIRKEK